MTQIIDGVKAANRLTSEIKLKAEKAGVRPGLAVIRIGDDPASEIYVAHKHKACEKIGFQSWNHHLPASVDQRAVLDLIHSLNADERVNGILLQLPLPGHLDEPKLIEAIDPHKDVDGLHPLNAGRLLMSRPGLIPCTPQGCVHLIKSVTMDLTGVRAVIIGRSNLVGKPLCPLLLKEDCTITMVHSKTNNMSDQIRQADIVIAAAGHPHLVKGEWIKEGAIVIDVGISRQDKKIVGDVETEQAMGRAKAITPVPGGVGPMTVAYLLKNTLDAALVQRVT